MCIGHYFQVKSCFKYIVVLVYVSNKTECFSYKGGCGLHALRYLKQKLAWTTNKWSWFISNVMLLTIAKRTKELHMYSSFKAYIIYNCKIQFLLCWTVISTY